MPKARRLVKWNCQSRWILPRIMWTKTRNPCYSANLELLKKYFRFQKFKIFGAVKIWRWISQNLEINFSTSIQLSPFKSVTKPSPLARESKYRDNCHLEPVHAQTAPHCDFSDSSWIWQLHLFPCARPQGGFHSSYLRKNSVLGCPLCPRTINLCPQTSPRISARLSKGGSLPVRNQLP